MTPEEKSLLENFLNRLKEAPVGPVDPEASTMIAKAADLKPGALYLTVQRALWLEEALKLAESKIKTLESQTPTSAGNPWLNSTWGSGASHTPLPPSHMANTASYAAPPALGMGSGFLGGGGSFLGTMAATAAGVVAGEMIADAFTHPSNHERFLDQSAADPLPPEDTDNLGDFDS